jgi:single-strand DNA-binding protein
MANFNLNKVILGGRLTADPELKTTSSGISVVTFSIAVNRRFSKDSAQQNETDFFNVTAWRQTAEFVSRYFRKGSSICVSGSLQNRNWTDQQGQKHYRTDIVADEVMFVDSRSDSPASADFGGAAPAFSSPMGTAPKFEEIKTDDDLPF